MCKERDGFYWSEPFFFPLNINIPGIILGLRMVAPFSTVSIKQTLKIKIRAHSGQKTKPASKL